MTEASNAHFLANKNEIDNMKGAVIVGKIEHILRALLTAHVCKPT